MLRTRTSRHLRSHPEVPEQIEPALSARRYILLLVDMSEAHCTLWCPYSSGLSDTLPRASREWWERWQASGLVRYPAVAGVTS